MGTEIYRTADGIGIVCATVGIVTGQDLLDATDHLRSEYAQDPALRYAVMDNSAVPEEKIDTLSLRVMAKQAPEPIPELAVAVVSPSDVLFGLGRMWETMAERDGLATRVVRTRDEAITWLEGELGQPVRPFDSSE